MGPRTSSQSRSERRTLIAVCAALALAVLGLYAQTRSFEFVSLDDFAFLTLRPEVRNGLSRADFWWALRTVDPNWHPLTWLTHQVDFTLFGSDAGSHHLVSAAIHATNAVLCFLALRALTGALWPSALVAALFAVHPLRAESVAWLSERKDVMSGLFWMLTLRACAAYARRRTWLRYVLVCLCLVLGLLSKTMLVSLPLVLLLLDYWPLERLGALAPARRQPPGRLATPSVASLLIEKLPLLALAVAASAVSVFTQTTVGGVRSLDLIPLSWRLVNAALVYVIYLRQTVWPSALAATYSHPALLAGSALADYLPGAIAATALLAAISALAIVLVRRAPYLFVGWFWYLITLVPVIGLVQIGRQGHADRYTYLPTLGIYIAVAWGLRDAVRRWPRLRVPTLALVGAVLVCFSALSWRQIGTWRSSRALYEHAIAVGDDNYFAEQTLGAALRADGDLPAARQHLEAAIRISPISYYAHEQLGLLYEQQNDAADAEAAFEHALQLSEHAFYARRHLAVMRRAEGRREEEVQLLTDELRFEPDDAGLHFDLGTALLQQERLAEATAELQRAVALQPSSAQAHNNLGVALAKQGRFDEAIPELERTLALNPSHAMAAKSLAWVRAQAAQP